MHTIKAAYFILLPPAPPLTIPRHLLAAQAGFSDCGAIVPLVGVLRNDHQVIDLFENKTDSGMAGKPVIASLRAHSHRSGRTVVSHVG
jgi:hypothetical protein